MSEENLPIQSTKTLVKALVVACSLAVVIFVTLVLPAEYNIDPSGIGNALGLTILSAPTSNSVSSVDTNTADQENREDETAITIAANSGLEYKFFVEQYEELNYEWSSDSDLYFDLHGEPENDTTGYFKSFAEATSQEMKGSITAPFTGSHGWYWRNRSNTEVIVSLKTKGKYEIIGLK
jgi:hypothetical protein